MLNTAKDIAAGGYQSALITGMYYLLYIYIIYTIYIEQGELYYWGLLCSSGLDQPTKMHLPQLKTVKSNDEAQESSESDIPISLVSLGGYHALAVDGKYLSSVFFSIYPYII